MTLRKDMYCTESQMRPRKYAITDKLIPEKPPTNYDGQPAQTIFFNHWKVRRYRADAPRPSESGNTPLFSGFISALQPVGV
jgi:hypothetical protein